MGWRLEIPGLPEGYRVIEWEDGLTLVNPAGEVVAQFGPMLPALGMVVATAWDDVEAPAPTGIRPAR
jgi:hypothetical protein